MLCSFLPSQANINKKIGDHIWKNANGVGENMTWRKLIIFSQTKYLVYLTITLKKNLCGECAVQVIEDEVDGIYFERCEECGKEFDLIEESGKFSSNFSYANGTCLRDYWNPTIICCDCALKRV